MESEISNPNEYYNSYPQKVIMRPGYPARAQFKSTLMWKLFGEELLKEIHEIRAYADVGGCFGFGANSMAFQISRRQEFYPQTFVFEIAKDFIEIGEKIFPYINFIGNDVLSWNGQSQIFDLVTLFDVIEHIPQPDLFLRGLSEKTRYAILKTPMETTGELRGSHPPFNQGFSHPDGHINFFDPNPYMKLLKENGFEVLKWHLVRSIVPRHTEIILEPETCVSERKMQTIFDVVTIGKKLLKKSILNVLSLPCLFQHSRKILGGGDHLCLVKSNKYLVHHFGDE